MFVVTQELETFVTGVGEYFKYVSFSHGHMRHRNQPEDKEGMFKKACPAWPQLLGRAERTREYVSTAQRRERRWQPFSTFPYGKAGRGA